MTAPATTESSTDLALSLSRIAEAARRASRSLAAASCNQKDQALRRMAEALRDSRSALQEENAKDLESAREGGLVGAMLERLALSDKVLDRMAEGLEEVADMPDPVGSISELRARPNGMKVGKMRIPLGVVGFIYESRPNVTADAAGLCLKSGNAVILRGGSEAICSNRAIAEQLVAGIASAGIDADAVQLVKTVDRGAVHAMLQLDDLIDLVIPRGGEGLIRYVVENTRIPVIKHYKGVCHTYVDRDAEPQMATELVVNGKVQRVSVCNSTETLLIHSECAPSLLPEIGAALVEEGVEIRACEESSVLLGGVSHVAASEGDFGTEYLDKILAVRVVKSLTAAVAHIQAHGTDHTETIVTESYPRAMRFLREVNSSTVLVNASTRFSDGYELGLGAEIGVSTTKIHAFGPMGVEGLTTEKFIVLGEGQLRH